MLSIKYDMSDETQQKKRVMTEHSVYYPSALCWLIKREGDTSKTAGMQTCNGF